MAKRGRATRRGGKRKPKVEASHEPVITKVTPFGLFVYHESKLLKKDFWSRNPVKCALKYFERDAEIKKINNTIPLKAKRISEGIYGDELKQFAVKNGFKEKEFSEFFQKFSVELTKLKLKFGFSEDKLVIQAVHNLEEVTKMANIFYERLSEWYGFYYPEFVKKVEHIGDFAEAVGQKRKEKSMGYDLADEDLKIISIAGKEMKGLLVYKKKLEEYIERKMGLLAPNLAKVAGYVLGAKLIAGAGSLKKLAEVPSSTIQLLGAEKALFRHIRKGTRPPKHGVILQHKLMAEVPIKERGKFARTLAGKISIVAKVDYHSKGNEIVWKTILKDLEARAKKLK